MCLLCCWLRFRGADRCEHFCFFSSVHWRSYVYQICNYYHWQCRRLASAPEWLHYISSSDFIYMILSASLQFSLHILMHIQTQIVFMTSVFMLKTKPSFLIYFFSFEFCSHTWGSDFEQFAIHNLRLSLKLKILFVLLVITVYPRKNIIHSQCYCYCSKQKWFADLHK